MHTCCWKPQTASKLLLSSLLRLSGLSHTVRHGPFVHKFAAIYIEPNEEKLPKLPVPELQDTIAKFIEYASVIGTESQLATTKKLADAFASGPGRQAQKELGIIANREKNWHNIFWLPDMYLKYRLPLPVFSNPAYLFPRRSFRSKDDMLQYIAVLVQGVYSYKQMLDRREVPIDKSTGRQGGQQMCMDQYWRMLNSHREPEVPQDLQHSLIQKEEDSYFILMMRSLMFVIKSTHNSEYVSTASILSQVKSAYETSKAYESSGPTSVGLISATQRDEAAALKHALFALDPKNEESWAAVTNADFIVCADFNAFSTADEETESDVSIEDQLLHLLHGSGCDKESCNRWFDKTHQFVVTADGTVGLNFEHSVAEGIVLVNMVEHLLQYIDQNICKRHIASPKSNTTPKQITWSLDRSLHNKLVEASTGVDQVVKDLQLSVFNSEKFGKQYLKSKKVSPDAVIQMCLQYAHYKCHGYLVSTYESASTRRFQLGRVDNIRTAHPQALAWVRIMSDRGADMLMKHRSFLSAINKQTAVMKESFQNVTGYGIDNHMSALREISKQQKLDADLFDDELFNEVFRFPLSTSQVPLTTEGTYVCYGPVTEDGYGCCYNPQKDYICFIVSALRSNERTDIEKFLESLASSTDEVYDLLETM